MSVAEHELLARSQEPPYGLEKPCLIAHSSPVSSARRVYIKRHGVPAAGLYVCHRCDVPSCIEDSHHFLGAQSENLKDGASKGRLSRSEAHKAAVAAYNKTRKGLPISEAQSAGLSKAREALARKQSRKQT